MRKKILVLAVIFIIISCIHFLLDLKYSVAQIRWSIYLQEIIIALTLSIGGLILQTLLLNPLAEPYILGVSSASTFGAVIAMFLSLSPMLIYRTLFAVAGSVVLTGFIFYLSRRKYSFSIGVALLAGVSFNAFFSSLIILLQSFLLPNDWAASIRWIMGNIDYISYPEIFLLLLALLIELVFIIFFHKELDIYLTGEEMAQSVGVDVQKLKRWGFISVSLATGLVSGVAGMLGFIGLVIPQIVKFNFHTNHRNSLLPIFLLSSIFLVGSGIISKNLLQGASLPTGVINSMLSAPFFIYILIRNYKGL